MPSLTSASGLGTLALTQDKFVENQYAQEKNNVEKYSGTSLLPFGGKNEKSQNAIQ
jgi:hypothetical protein